jgi:hypothetical protein
MNAVVDRRRAQVPPPVPASLRARIRVAVAEAGIPDAWRGPMEALLAVTFHDSLGLDEASLRALALHGTGMLATVPRFHAVFHRLRSSMSY